MTYYVVIKCADCQQEGHPDKTFHQCQLYVKPSNTVHDYYKSRSKRLRYCIDYLDNSQKRKRFGKDDYETKREKAAGKRKRRAKYKSNTGNAICSSCHQSGHKSVRSRDCPNYKLKQSEFIEDKLGKGFQSYTRKLYLSSVVRQEHKEHFATKVINRSYFIRQVIFRSQLFVNHWIMSNSSMTNITSIFEQDFWYSIAQLIMGKGVTNKSYISNAIVFAFVDFSQQFPTIKHPLKETTIKRGFSDTLSAACKVVATCYMNFVVETFKKRTIYFLRRKLYSIYPVNVYRRQKGYVLVLKLIYVK
ncbi:MAG: hypothetical protein LBE37_20445 [Sphingobacterium sp.]|jgi:hypothetical protein|nr:hypothetical protein [Sphingobacterium sp.]